MHDIPARQYTVDESKERKMRICTLSMLRVAQLIKTNAQSRNSRRALDLEQRERLCMAEGG